MEPCALWAKNFVSSLYPHTLYTRLLFLDVLKLYRIGPQLAESLRVSVDISPNNLKKIFMHMVNLKEFLVNIHILKNSTIDILV